jgi:proteasome alpha subunit
MSMPFYVAPEQLMRDKADYARKNIARGRPLVATLYDDGILITAENTSRTLKKISEIYDRIAFAGVGKASEFDALRQNGISNAEVTGYTYSREDVEARSLANQYAQIIGRVFTHEMKPFEVEILVAELGHTADEDRLFHIFYDGDWSDDEDIAVLGGDPEPISERLRTAFKRGWKLEDAVRASVAALAGPDRTLTPDVLEVAVLGRSVGRRAFRRLEETELAGILGTASATPAKRAAKASRAAEKAAEAEAPDGPDDLA